MAPQGDLVIVKTAIGKSVKRDGSGSGASGSSGGFPWIWIILAVVIAVAVAAVILRKSKGEKKHHNEQ